MAVGMDFNELINQIKPKLQAFYAKLKENYTRLEDKYYNSMDKVNETVPIYKVIDPIDKHVPSLVLFTGLLAVIIIFLLLLLLGPAPNFPVVLVVDEDGMALSGVDVKYTSKTISLTLITDEEGKVSLSVDGNVEIEIEEEGFQPYSETIQIVFGEVKTITLLGEAAPILLRSIEVKDNDTQQSINNKEIIVRFNCSGAGSAPRDIHNYSYLITVQQPEGCGTLSATVNVSGYDSETRDLGANTTIFWMQSKASFQEEKTARLNVNVTDPGQNPLPGIKLLLWHDSGTVNPTSVGSGFTDSSGHYSFTPVLGSYQVRAVDESGQFENTESGFVSLASEDQTETIDLVMQPITPANQRQLYLKIVDSETAQGVQSNVSVFANDSFVTTVSTDAQGIFQYAADFNSSYGVLVQAQGYVTKVVSPVQVALPGQEPRTIELETAQENDDATPKNYGMIEGLVIDDEGAEVQGATVYVYNNDYPGIWMDEPKTSDSDGKVSFTSLPLLGDEYYLEATDGQASGTSPREKLFAQEPLELTVQLISGTAIIDLEVFDAASASALESAKVELIDSITEDRLYEGATDEDGKPSDSMGDGMDLEFTVDKVPYLRVGGGRNPGYLTHYSRPFNLVSDEEEQVHIDLLKIDDTDLNLFLKGILKANGSSASTLAQGEDYQALFRLEQPYGSDETIVHVSLGEESEAFDELSGFITKVGYLPSILDASTVKSTSFNASNPFADGSKTQGNFRQANIHFDNLSAGVYEITIKFKVKDSAEGDLQFNWAVKTVDRDKETPLQSRVFELGAISCNPATDPDCPEFLYSFKLQSAEDDRYTDPTTLTAEAASAAPVTEGAIYTLSYRIRNQMTADASNVSLDIGGDFDFQASTTQSLGEIKSKKSVESTINFIPDTPGTGKQMSFELTGTGVPDSGNDAALYFDVSALAAQTLLVQQKTSGEEAIYAEEYNLLDLSAYDNGQLVEGQIISIDVTKNGQHLKTGGINQTGYGRIDILRSDNVLEGDEICFIATASAFTAEKCITATDYSADPGDVARFGCIEFNPEEATTFTIGGSGNFTIDATDCPQDVRIKLDTSVNVADVTLSADTFTIPAGGSRAVTVNNAQYPGQYGIIVLGAYGTESFSPFFEYTVNVNQRASANFDIDQTEFDLSSGNAFGTVTNQNSKYIEDLRYPRLAVREVPRVTIAEDIQQSIQPTEADTYYFDVYDQGGNCVVGAPKILEIKGEEVLLESAYKQRKTCTVYECSSAFDKVDPYAFERTCVVLNPILGCEAWGPEEPLFPLTDKGCHCRKGDPLYGPWETIESRYIFDQSKFTDPQVIFDTLNLAGLPDQSSCPLGAGDSLIFDFDSAGFPADGVWLNFIDFYMTDRHSIDETVDGPTNEGATHNVLVKFTKTGSYSSIVEGVYNADDFWIGSSQGPRCEYYTQESLIDNQGNALTACQAFHPILDYCRDLADAETEVCDNRPVWQGMLNLCHNKGFNDYNADCPGLKVDNTAPADPFGGFTPTDQPFEPYWQALIGPGKELVSGIMLSVGGSAARTTYLYGFKANIAQEDWDRHGVIDFVLSSQNFRGRKYGLIVAEDYVQGQSAPQGQAFHVKFTGPSQEICYNWENKEGGTGQYARPRVKFDWRWDNIAADACDADNPNFIYCDATQFSLALIKKLEVIGGKLEQGQDYDDLLSFEAYLMKDGYSADFQDDFDRYYRAEAFLGAPASYDNSYDGFFKIFSNPERFIFTDFAFDPARTQVKPLPGPGKYRVDIGLSFDRELEEFFNGSDPNVTIKIYLRQVDSPSADNPLYHFPLDAMLGYDNASGRTERRNYGRPLDLKSAETVFLFREGDDRFWLAESDLGDYNSYYLDEMAKVDVEVENNFETTNKTARGSVLRLANNTLTVSLSDATPILMMVEEMADGNASNMYYLTHNGGQVSSNDYLTIWNGCGSSLGTGGCADFANNPLALKQNDAAASSMADNAHCSLAVGADNAFGLSWFKENNTIGEEEDKVFFRTVFYTPVGDEFLLHAGCADVDSASGTPVFKDAWGTGISENSRIALQLNYTSERDMEAGSVQDALSLIDSQDMCVAVSENEVDIWWHEQNLLDELDLTFMTQLDVTYPCQ